ncbi:venom carboxylesterase-6-like isoform X2 [Chrysoperla carnea]|nr:venom carboxylesterase-6-like isoform X2 [Chrysoperla carnea]
MLPNGESKNNTLRPVVIYFHAGEFYGSSGISSYHGPQYLLDKDIVLVTVNYRLGTLGFINTGDENAPGNLGLKDQVIAMRWVQQNILSFGGNPEEVTIMGYSSGSCSVALHLVSPMSKGLFHRAIAMSGSPTSAIKYTNQLDLAKKQAEILNCPSNTSQEIIDCLRTKDAEDISKTFFSFREVGSDPLLIWRPVIEPDHPGEKFLTEDPAKLFHNGNFTKVPFMIGVSENEFAGNAYNVVADENLRNVWNSNFAYVAPIAFGYERNTSKSLNISNKLRDFYIGEKEINLDSVEGLGKLYADSVGWSISRLAYMVAQSNDYPVYYYKFAYSGRFSHFYSPFTNKTIGASHLDELIYLFYIRAHYLSFPLFKPSDPETKMVEKMTTLWSNFIKTGNPTPEVQEVTNNVTWIPFTTKEENYLNIDSNLTMEKNLFADRYSVWEHSFPFVVKKIHKVTIVKTVYIVRVHTPLGKILGSTNFETRLGKKIYAFRGIRYAESPTGSRRFQPPEPVKPWGEETLNATEDGPACPQPIRINPEEFGWSTSEDCLRLNVYTTLLNRGNEKKLHPVVIFFHAGGFYGVSGISNYHGPQYLLDKDVVLVTVNYRLGTLGFISTGDENAPGNLGLKDQVQAMRWVQQNIKSFGGNPDEVTIMGYSAGSYSVALHLLSPMSKGLFHRGIAMSGSPTATFPFTDQLDVARKQAQLLNCPSNTSKEIIDCLRTKDAEEISTTFFDFQEVGSDPTLIWRPVIEPDHPGEKFLTDDPNKLFYEGKFTKVPFMIGVNEMEFAGGAYDVVANETLREIWNNNFEYVAPIAFGYERNTSKSLVISKSLRNFYLGSREIDFESIDDFSKLYADGIGWSVNRLACLLAKSNDFPVYFYKFAYKGRFSHFYSPFTNETIGASHHDELMYLFYISVHYLSFPFFEPTDPEIEMVEKMTTLWSNFIKSGNPTPEKEEVTNNVIWRPFTLNEETYMNIDSNLTMEKDLFDDRYALWENLFPFTIRQVLVTQVNRHKVVHNFE